MAAGVSTGRFPGGTGGKQSIRAACCRRQVRNQGCRIRQEDTILELPDFKVLEPPGPEGLQHDLPCPRCRYNLRGLTLPRCPECGFEFRWEDIPRLLDEIRRRRERRNSVIAGCVLAMPLIGVLAFVPAILLFFVALSVWVLAPFAVSGCQAAVEMCLVWPIIGQVGWRRLRAWWEGVLIGYGVSVVSMLLAGRYWSLGDFGWDAAERWGLLHFYVGTTIEVAIVQFWVVRRRWRQWGVPVASRKLWVACAVSKLVTGTLWFLMPFRLMAVR